MRSIRTEGSSGRRRRRSAVAALAAVALVLAACGGSDDTTEGTTNGDGSSTASTTGDTGDTGDTAGSTPVTDARELIIARDMDINSLDPARVYCDTCMIFSTAVYETLVTRDPADITKQIPRLAESWEANADNTVFTFQLNPAAKFADGSPVEAKDVKWSWERLNHVKGSASYMMDGYTNIDTPDASTVVVTFGAPNSAFLAIVSASQMGITNSDEAIAAGSIADETAETADQSEQFYFTRSLGSGPFELESYTEGDALVLKRNDNYWGTKSPFPKVTFKQVKDSASQLQQLQAGDVDIAMQISLDSLSQIESDPNLTVTTTDSYNFAYIALSAGAESAPPELADPKVREAIKLAIDYDGMLDVTVGGKGKKQASTIPNGFEGSADLPLPAQDVDKAKQLLTEAGVTSLTLKAMYPNINVYGVDFSVMMQKVQQDLKEIGVDVQLEPAEFSAWLDTIRGVGIPLTAVYFAPDHPDTSQYPQYFGMIEGAPWSGRAGGGAAGTPIINEKEAPLLAAALAASGEERVQLYTELGQEMINDLVHFPMVNPQLVIASQKDITGNHYSGCCNLDLSFLGITG